MNRRFCIQKLTIVHKFNVSQYWIMTQHTHTQPLTALCLGLPVPSVPWRCWLGGRKGIRPVKNWVVMYRRGYLPGGRCRLAYGPADATATHCLLLPGKGPLNGFVFCVWDYLGGQVPEETLTHSHPSWSSDIPYQQDITVVQMPNSLNSEMVDEHHSRASANRQLMQWLFDRVVFLCSTRHKNTGWVEKSKLLILSEYVNKTEKTGRMWTNKNSYRENGALSDIFT